MENNNGSFRRKQSPFSQVSNIALRDENLSLKAKGLYSLIQSYITIPDFILYKNTLLKKCKEGRDGFNTAWKELKTNGYLIQYKIKLDNGTYTYEYELTDYPCTEIPSTDNPPTEKPVTEKPHVYNNTYSNKTNLNNTKSNYTKSYGKKSNSFIDNCSSREYSAEDFKNIEDKLLGWNKESEEE